MDGNTGHRAPKQRVGMPGLPERPKGLTARARRYWDEYVERMAPLGTLRPADGFALGRLAQDAADLEELRAGLRRMAGELTRQDVLTRRRIAAIDAALVSETLPAGERVERIAERQALTDTLIVGNAAVMVAKTHEGRRISATISTLATRVARQELQFGLTPASAARLEAGGGGSSAWVPAPVEAANPFEEMIQ